MGSRWLGRYHDGSEPPAVFLVFIVALPDWDYSFTLEVEHIAILGDVLLILLNSCGWYFGALSVSFPFLSSSFRKLPPFTGGPKPLGSVEADGRPLCLAGKLRSLATRNWILYHNDTHIKRCQSLDGLTVSSLSLHSVWWLMSIQLSRLEFLSSISISGCFSPSNTRSHWP